MYMIRTIIKWLLIIWSVACLGGIFVGLSQTVFPPAPGQAELVGAALGLTFALACWLVLWAVVAGPLYLLYKLLKRSKPSAS